MVAGVKVEQTVGHQLDYHHWALPSLGMLGWWAVMDGVLVQQQDVETVVRTTAVERDFAEMEFAMV